MSKSPYTPEFRAKVAQEYIDGLGFFPFIANYYCIDEKTVHINFVRSFISTSF